MEYWHVLYTKPHNEFRVQATLLSRGITCFLPSVPVSKVRTGRAQMRAFFPCYLFAHFDMEVVGESSIAYLPGIRYVLRTGGHPTIVAPALVEYISRRLATTIMDAGGEVLVRGDAVQILREGFKDIDAVFDERLSPDGRVRIFLRHLEEQYPRRNSIEHLIPTVVHIKEIRKKPSAHVR